MIKAGSRGFLSCHHGIRVVAAVLIALVFGVVCFMVWHHLREDVLPQVGVVEARLVAPKRLELLVDTCHPPQVSLWESDVELRVEAMSASPSSQDGVACQFSVEIDLLKPLGERAVVDEHTGQAVNVTTAR